MIVDISSVIGYYSVHQGIEIANVLISATHLFYLYYLCQRSEKTHQLVLSAQSLSQLHERQSEALSKLVSIVYKETPEASWPRVFCRRRCGQRADRMMDTTTSSAPSTIGNIAIANITGASSCRIWALFWSVIQNSMIDTKMRTNPDM